MAEETPG